MRGAASFVSGGVESGSPLGVDGVGLEERLLGALAAWEGAFRGCRASVAGAGSIMSGVAKERGPAPNMREAPPDFEGRSDNLAET